MSEVKPYYEGCPDPRRFVSRDEIISLRCLLPVIEVPKVSDIPVDWPGYMGVPISYMDKHDPERFEIVDTIKPKIDGKEIYQRIIIRNKKPELPEWVALSDYGLEMRIAAKRLEKESQSPSAASAPSAGENPSTNHNQQP